GALGFSVEDTAEAIGLMANAGIKSTQAGTSLRTIMTNLSGEVVKDSTDPREIEAALI
ncbi:MAG: phage tail tape measure protein, partial [Alistipes sp.]|nr:phage tail tape measure protein [Alistipes sp.]